MYFASLIKIISDELLQQQTITKFKAIQSIVNPPFMVYNTENRVEPRFRNYQVNHKFQGKRQWILLLEIEKKESKTLCLKSFQKILEQISQSPQYNQSRQSQTSRVDEMFMRKLAKSYIYLEILVPYLNNPSEETIF